MLLIVSNSQTDFIDTTELADNKSYARVHFNLLEIIWKGNISVRALLPIICLDATTNCNIIIARFPSRYRMLHPCRPPNACMPASSTIAAHGGWWQIGNGASSSYQTRSRE